MLANKMATYKNLNFTIDQSEKQLFQTFTHENLLLLNY